jgi:hypothetical protein
MTFPSSPGNFRCPAGARAGPPKGSMRTVARFGLAHHVGFLRDRRTPPRTILAGYYLLWMPLPWPGGAAITRRHSTEPVLLPAVPVLPCLVGIAFPLGLLPGPDHAYPRSVLRNPLTKLVPFGLSPALFPGRTVPWMLSRLQPGLGPSAGGQHRRRVVWCLREPVRLPHTPRPARADSPREPSHRGDIATRSTMPSIYQSRARPGVWTRPCVTKAESVPDGYRDDAEADVGVVRQRTENRWWLSTSAPVHQSGGPSRRPRPAPRRRPTG